MPQLPNNSSSEAGRTTWTPENYLTASKLKEQLYAVIILNRPIHLDQEFVIEMWNSGKWNKIQCRFPPALIPWILQPSFDTPLTVVQTDG